MDEQRDEKGRFKPGNEAGVGKGRPRKEVERAYLDAIVDIVTLERWNKIVLKAAVDAAKGAPEARRWLSDYLVGKPPQILELRAGEAAVLKEILLRFEAEGVTASEVFHAMLATFVDAEVENEDEG